jgi:hypothetical protein
MRAPRLAVRILGNSACTLAIVGASGYATYLWWTQQAHNDWAPLLALMATGAAVNANQKLTAYKNWKMSWDVLGGDVPRAGKYRIRLMIGIPLWLVFAVGVIGLDYHRPANVVAAACFAAASVLMLCRLVPGSKQPAAARPKPRKLVTVSVLLPVPGHSPSVQQIVQSLPAYCARLA